MKSKKNILCLSWCDADDVMNYGQILQGCAMMHLLRQMCKGEIIYVSYFPRGPKSRVKYYLKHYNLCSGHMIPYIKSKIIINKFIKHNNIKYKRVTRKNISDKLTQKIDIMICGSDQIWHPQNFDKNYFLNFGNKNIKRIAFSVSLPKTQVESQFINEYKEIVKSMACLDSIAVREKGSVNFISQLSGKSVVSTFDPTYLVPSKMWLNILEPMPIDSNYIFVYIPNGMDYTMAEQIEIIKNELEIQAVVVMITRGKNLCRDSLNLKFISIGQFLYLIKHAVCVITSSFHAVVFSTIFHADFYAYDVQNEMRGEDIRISDLLQQLGLSDRKIGSRMVQYDTIDYENVDKKIEENKIFAIKYLQDLLCENDVAEV